MMRKKLVYTIPYAGGSRYSFGSFINHFQEDVCVKALELPGRGGRFSERLLFRMDQMIVDLAEQIKPDAGLPYAIYGHSMGGLMAYLLTRWISEQHLPEPRHLFITGCPAPIYRRQRQERYALEKQEFWKMLSDLGGVSEETLRNEDLKSFYEPILRADIEALDTYIYDGSVPLRIPITVIRGNREATPMDKFMEWSMESVAGVNIEEWDGDHFFIFDNAKKITSMISSCFQQ